jgi:hypothetical protein
VIKPQHTLMLLSFILGASLARADISRFYHTDYELNIKPDDPAYNKPLADAAIDIDSFGLAEVSIEAIVQPASDNASFDGGKLMYLPRNMEFTNSFGLNPYMKSLFDIEAVFSHEYGHAVFDQIATKSIADYKLIRAIKLQQSAIDLRILHERPSKEVLAQLREQQKALDNQLLNSPNTKRLYILSLPYNELFADVIAVYHTHDKSAIFDALDNPNIQHNYSQPHPLASRDFNANNAVEGWTDRTPHGMFGPIRTFLGQESCWPKTQEERSLKLKVLSEILMKDIQERYDAGSTEALPAFNVELIQKLAPVCDMK